jgi:hypothetical protein
VRTLKSGDSVTFSTGHEFKIGPIKGKRVSVSVLAPLSTKINVISRGGS